MSLVSGERGVMTYNGVAVYGAGNNSARGADVLADDGCPVALIEVGVSVQVGEGPGVFVGMVD